MQVLCTEKNNYCTIVNEQSDLLEAWLRNVDLLI